MPRIQTADITSLIRERFQIKGAGSIDTLAPEIVGTLDLDPLLKFAALTPDVTETSVAIGAANTIGTTDFTLPGRALLTGWSISSTVAHLANADWVELQVRDPAGSGLVNIHTTVVASGITLTGEMALYPNALRENLPMFIPAGWELRLRARTGAGGAATFNLDAFTLIEPTR